jgi:NADH dehydrogenase [ubiquinone] 1 alpha subcomplex assembly factor 7
MADVAGRAACESGVSGLGAHLERLIALRGPLSLAEYMIESLWHPSEGYYARSEAIGRAGDYVTAPEISQMFGELVGIWCTSVWIAMGRPRHFELVELGPGRGTMMADALRAARVAPGFLQAAHVHLVEASARLRDIQRTLARERDVTWHDGLGTLPDGPTILVANEFLDALPIVQFERTESGWRERLVEFDKASGRFRFTRAQHETPAAALLPPAFASAPLGAIAELCPAALSLAASLAKRLAAEGGAALFIDYGPRESTLGATLQASRGHRRHDPFDEPGRADLTAHVDFANFARAASAAGAACHGPVDQGIFLRHLGIRERAERLSAAAGAAQTDAVQGALRRLIDGAEMGTLFKALALTHPFLTTPAGFEQAR